MIVIDSLSSLFAGVQGKHQQNFDMLKELLYYFKSLTKKHFVSVVYTNNTKDAGFVRRVTDVKNLVGEPLIWAVDK